MHTHYDFLVVGAGIAGSSIAAALSNYASVRLLEMEDQPGYHSTGRSAALFSEAYGNETIRALTRASRAAFFAPAAGFTTVDLVKPRKVLIVARPDQAEAFETFLASARGIGRLERLTVEQAVALCPILRPEVVFGAALSTDTADIDVHELQQGYLRGLKASGGVLSTATRVVSLERVLSGWEVSTPEETISADIVVNAAGAWAGEIARLAGARDVGLRPLRRTACLIDAPANTLIADWPMVLNVEEDFYLKPDAGSLLLSPADEAETEPCDAQAEELDIAIAIDRIQQATTLEVRRVSHKWAGLRTFVADSSPVVGFDPIQPKFFWMAALGGYGIQTAPALGRIAASLALGRDIDPDLQAFDIDLASMSPGRVLAQTSDMHLIGVAKS